MPGALPNRPGFPGDLWPMCQPPSTAASVKAVRINGFPKDFQDFLKFPEIMIFLENKSCQIVSGTFLWHPEHAYATGNDPRHHRVIRDIHLARQAAEGEGEMHSAMRFHQ